MAPFPPLKAVRYFETALRVKPNFADAHYNLGLVFTRLPGKTADAEAEFQTAVRLDPGHEQAHNSLALLLMQSRDNNGKELSWQ